MPLLRILGFIMCWTVIIWLIYRELSVVGLTLFHRCKFGKSSEPRLLDDLERSGLVVYTPSREIQGRMVTSYDDRWELLCYTGCKKFRIEMSRHATSRSSSSRSFLWKSSSWVILPPYIFFKVFFIVTLFSQRPAAVVRRYIACDIIQSINTHCARLFINFENIVAHCDICHYHDRFTIYIAVDKAMLSLRLPFMFYCQYWIGKTPH